MTTIEKLRLIAGIEKRNDERIMEMKKTTQVQKTAFFRLMLHEMLHEFKKIKEYNDKCTF